MKAGWGCRYGFHKEPAGGSDPEGHKKERLLEIFGDWTDMVTDLIRATPEEDVLRRDIYDRPPIFRWTKVLPASGRTSVCACWMLLKCNGCNECCEWNGCNECCGCHDCKACNECSACPLFL